MKITNVDGPPGFQEFDDIEDRMTSEHVEDVREIFNTPLTGSYNWDYTVADNRIKRLYELGKELNWNGSIDLDWSNHIKRGDLPVKPEFDDLGNVYPEYNDMSEEEKREVSWHASAWGLSQFLHGEQGALLVASQLVSCAPTYQAKLYAASQCFDEARHVEVFNRYLQDVMGMSYPISPSLKALLDKGLTDPRWDLKFIAMQIIIEGLALAAFQSTKMSTSCPLLRDLTHYVIRDEARHVTFGINYLEDFNKTLSKDEIEDRARFAYEACVIMRDRIQNYDLGKKFFGYSEQEAREAILKSGVNDDFRGLLFNRVMPNLKKIGLLTESVRPLYDELGLLEYEVAPSDFEIDWAEISKPLESSDEIETQADEQAEVIKEMFHNH